jgi:hypothetical protein
MGKKEIEDQLNTLKNKLDDLKAYISIDQQESIYPVIRDLEKMHLNSKLNYIEN